MSDLPVESLDIDSIQLDEKILWDISKYLETPKWVRVGRHFAIPNSVIDQIGKKYHEEHPECAFRMLLYWKEAYPTSTLKDLFAALQNEELHKSASDIKAFVKELRNPANQYVSQPSVVGSTKNIGKIAIYEEKPIGEGGNRTTVYKGKFENREVAVKRVPIEYKMLADSEIKILQAFDGHPNIVTYFGQEHDNTFFYIALELCQCNLERFCRRDYKPMRDKKDAKSLLKEITEGLSYLHQAGAIHRDIKPENILISQPNAVGHIKALISDFGYSRQLREGRQTYTPSSKKGTSGWVANEVIRATGKVTNAIDIFSLGCVFYYVISNGKQLFYSDHDVLHRPPEMGQLKFDQHVIRNLIERMINRNFQHRPSCADILFDIYFWDEKDILYFIKSVKELLDSNEVEADKKRAVEKDALSILSSGDGKSPQKYQTVVSLISEFSKINPTVEESMTQINKLLSQYPKFFPHLNAIFDNYQPRKSSRSRLGSESFRRIKPRLALLTTGATLAPVTVKPETKPQRTSPVSLKFPALPTRSTSPAPLRIPGGLHDHRKPSLGVPPTEPKSPTFKPKSSPSPAKSVKYSEYFSVDAHDQRITHVTFSTTGKMLATCSADQSLKVWLTGSDIVQYKKSVDALKWKEIAFSEFNSDDSFLLVSGVRANSSGEVVVFNLKDGLPLLCTVPNDLPIASAWYSKSCFLSGQRSDNRIYKVVLNDLPKINTAPCSHTWEYCTTEDVRFAGIIQKPERLSSYEDNFDCLVYSKGQSIGVKMFVLCYGTCKWNQQRYGSVSAKPQFDLPDITIPCDGEVCDMVVFSSQKLIYVLTKSRSLAYKITSIELTPDNTFPIVRFTIPPDFRPRLGAKRFLDVSGKLLIGATKTNSTVYIWETSGGQLVSTLPNPKNTVLTVGCVAINRTDDVIATCGEYKLTLWKNTL